MKNDLRNMNLRQLRYFLEVAQLHSFTRAASTLHVAQSALSRQIRMLEEDLGLPLFVRLDRGVTLTEAGERLRDRVASLLRDLEQMREDVIAVVAEPRGELAIGVPPSMRDMATVPTMIDYYKSFPKVALHVHEGISIDLTKLVQDGKLDCAVVVDMMDVPLVTAHPLMREQLYLIGPRSARLSLRKGVALKDVSSKALMLTTRPNSLRLVVEDALAGARLPANIIVDSNSTASMVELAAAGMAYTVLPYSAAWRAIRERRLTAAPIRDLTIAWVFIHPSGKPLSLAALEFKRMLFEQCSRKIAGDEWVGGQLCDQR